MHIDPNKLYAGKATSKASVPKPVATLEKL